MPSKGRWTLNPRKWFGTLNSATHKTDRKPQVVNHIPPKPPQIPKAPTSATTAQKHSSTPTAPRYLTARSKPKPTTTPSINDYYTANASSSLTQIQLPSHNMQREKSSALLSVSSAKVFIHANTLIPARTEPSIRKHTQLNEKLLIDATRWNTDLIVTAKSKLLPPTLLKSSHENLSEKNSTKTPLDMNASILSNECIIDYPQSSSHNFIDKCNSPTGTRSSSSIDDNDVRDESTSSGIFTDERADVNDNQRTASKDTLSTYDVISVESIDDSQTSLNRCPTQTFTQCYRLPVPTYEHCPKSPPSLRSKPVKHSSRPISAEGILKDNPINTPVITKSRQSSAAIVKKIEKRMPTNRSPTATLEKVGLVRIANDTYRLTAEKDDHLYRRHRPSSIVQYSTHDDSLPPAVDEESYATIPRTSSTEQLNENIQNDVRAIINDCLRPVVGSINPLSDTSKKHQSRSKRSHTNNEQGQINIENMIDKLVSSIDCSAYAQYQRRWQ